MPTDIVAVDVAILVPEPVAVRAREVNRTISQARPGELHLDDTHLAHVTLAQQFVERARLADLFGALDLILRHEPALALRISGAVEAHGTISLTLDEAPDLQRLHEMVMDAIESFEAPEGGTAAFDARGGEAIRARDVDWVRNYREISAYAHYRPHVTVGHGDSAPAVQPMEFRADRIGACQLGRFCSCRAVLREWALRGANGA